LNYFFDELAPMIGSGPPLIGAVHQPCSLATATDLVFVYLCGKKCTVQEFEYCFTDNFLWANAALGKGNQALETFFAGEMPRTDCIFAFATCLPLIYFGFTLLGADIKHI